MGQLATGTSAFCLFAFGAPLFQIFFNSDVPIISSFTQAINLVNWWIQNFDKLWVSNSYVLVGWLMPPCRLLGKMGKVSSPEWGAGEKRSILTQSLQASTEKEHWSLRWRYDEERTTILLERETGWGAMRKGSWSMSDGTSKEKSLDPQSLSFLSLSLSF